MKNLDFEDKAIKLLGILSHHAEIGTDNIRYLAFVLQAYYDDGYKDALYALEGEHNDLL